MKEDTLLGFLLLISICCTVDSKCSKGCDLALASYNFWPYSNLSIISKLLQSTINDILDYNPQVPNKDFILLGTRINVPFTCDCINDEFLGHVFYYNINSGDTYDKVATLYYANLTTLEWLAKFNNYDPLNILDTGKLNVTVNCSCGDSKVSKHYGLFTTYPLQPNDSLSLVAAQSNVSEDVLRSYNPDSDFDAGNGLVFVPGRDKNGKFPPLESSAGRIIADISVAGVAGFLLLSVCIYIGLFRKKQLKGELAPEICFGQADHGSPWDTASGSTGGASPVLTGISVDKSVVFSYKELSKATDTFSLANKIGEGGFGSVYYAELRGEKAAIKKMNIQASKEFLTELKVLTHVHHLNLVRLIGYCVEVSLFLVYEYVDNGNLSQHLRGSGRDPLPWSTRVQIALDSARGLEYMHEHTVPVYVHCDIKSANILIEKNFHGKVADFGLTKLIEAGRTLRPTCLVGTFGYMPPECARFVSVSSQADVYAFGVVLYELISAKEAVVKQNESIAEPKGLVVLFADVFNQLDPREDLCKLIDPRLGDSYPFDSVHKMAQLARACTQENPQLRPTMRSIVVALMTLSSSTDDWDVGSSYENQAFVRSYKTKIRSPRENDVSLSLEDKRLVC